MVGAVAIATALTVWDLERQSLAVVDRLAQTTRALARAIANEVHPGAAVDDAFVRQLALEDGAALFVVDEGRVTDTAGRLVLVPALLDAVRSPEQAAVLTRDDAVVLGLPARRAVAAQARMVDGRTLLVVSSAAPERQVTRREEWMVGVSMTLVALVAVGLGGVALKREGERLALAHEVERGRLEFERDEQLGRAERIAVASALSIGVSHELATPLGVISARVEQLRRGAGDERARAALDSIAGQIEHMRRVMSGFLALARGEAPQAVRMAPAALARSAAKAVVHRYAHSGLALELEFDDNLPPISVDEPLFQQALANVLLNAAQASEQGGHVVLRLVREGDAVVFEVCDRGTGIDPALLSKVTEPFVTTRATSGGTGLGLAITTEILRHHGGRLELKSPPQGGLVARIIVPMSSEGTS